MAALSDPLKGANCTHSPLLCTYTVLVSVYPHAFFPSGPRAARGRSWAVHAHSRRAGKAQPRDSGQRLNCTEWKDGAGRRCFHPCPGLLTPAPWDSVWSSTPGGFASVPSVLTTGRTGGETARGHAQGVWADFREGPRAQRGQRAREGGEAAAGGSCGARVVTAGVGPVLGRPHRALSVPPAELGRHSHFRVTQL